MEHTYYQKIAIYKSVGIPNEMFDLPEIYGYQKCGTRVNKDHVEWILSYRDIHTEASNILNQCNEELTEYFKYELNVMGFTVPARDWQEARIIYLIGKKVRRQKVTKFSSSDENFYRRKFLPTKIFTDELFLPTNIFCRRKFQNCIILQ